jgi:DNA primase
MAFNMPKNKIPAFNRERKVDTIPKLILPYNLDIFEVVREIPLIEIIERYSPNPIIYKYDKPRVLCPFHGDKNPSLSLKGQRWKCFGCNESGDGIDFVAKLFNLLPIEAVKTISSDFGFQVLDKPQTVEQQKAIRKRKRMRAVKKVFNHWWV